LQLTKRDIYIFGSSANSPDEVNYNNGIYYFLLKPEARDEFHNRLTTYFTQMQSKDQESSIVDPGQSSENKFPTESLDSKIIDQGNG